MQIRTDCVQGQNGLDSKASLKKTIASPTNVFFHLYSAILIEMTKAHLTLAAFRKASPLDLGPVAFVQWAHGQGSKQALHGKYIAIASDAASSKDLDVQAIRKQMQELWVKEQGALKSYWKDEEPLRKLRVHFK